MTTASAPGGSTPIRVVLADDHEIVRTGLRAELTRASSEGSATPVFEVVGEADNAVGAIDVITARKPDLVV